MSALIGCTLFVYKTKPLQFMSLLNTNHSQCSLEK